MEKREAWSIIIAILIMAIVLYFPRLLGDSASIGITNSIIISGLIIITSVSIKNLVGKVIDVSISHSIWEFKRFWITYHSKFRRPIPVGALVPVILSFFSTGKVKFLTLLQYESKALPSKIVKKYGRRRFENIMEWDDALVVFYSMVGLLILGCAAKFAGDIMPFKFFLFLSKYCLYYPLANMIPFGSLDGMKLIMGSKPLYVFTLVLIVVAALVVFF